MSRWPEVRLEDVFDVARGGSPRPIDSFITDDPNGVNWIMIGDASEGSKYISSTKKRIIKEGVKKSRMVSAGDFLLTNSMSFGKPYILKTSGCIHDGWLVLSPRHDQIHSDFFYHLLGSDVVYSKFKKLAAGAVVKNLNSELVRGVLIPLPPLAEQKRIAAILDKADAIRRKLQESLRLSDDFLRSVFLDMFGDPVTNPKGWPIVTIRDLLVATSYGTSKKASETDGQFPCLRMNNITYSGGWDFKSLKYVDLDKHEQSKNLVHAGQLLFNRTNSKELVGKTAVYRRKEAMAFAGYLVRGIANSQADTEYISAYLNLPHGKAVLQGMCKNIIGMANINAEEFKSIRIQKPPVTLQKQFAAIVHSTELKKTTLNKFITESETLFSSLQQRAFRGEL